MRWSRRCDGSIAMIEPDEFFSVRLGTIGGESWTCRGKSAEDVSCGAHSSAQYVDLGDPRVLTMDEALNAGVMGLDRDAYHRYVFLGESVASPPAMPVAD